MRFSLLQNRPQSWAGILAVLLLFVGYGYLRYQSSTGQDLGSSFVGSRLLIQKQGSHLFSYDSYSFAEVGEDEDDTLTPVANDGGFYGFLHPYVQTPLWAWLLEPLCRRVDFATFNRIFCLLDMLCFAGLIWLCARFWAPSFFNPAAIALVSVCLAFSEPFLYAMYLTQTHVLFVFLTVVALICEQEEHEWVAGFLLACAAAVKVTPGLLILYWLIRGRWRAALSGVLWSGIFWVGARAAVGPALWHAYLDNLHRISGVLLISQNNQSLAAVIMQHFYPAQEVLGIQILPLPSALRSLSSASMLALTAWGAWMDRRQEHLSGETGARAPLGAMVAIVAATLFAPIAWTHYSIVLLVPFMILVDKNKRIRSPLQWVLIIAALLLNFQPIATDVVNNKIGPYSLVRSEAFACALVLLALIVMGYMMSRHQKDVVSAELSAAANAV